MSDTPQRRWNESDKVESVLHMQNAYAVGRRPTPPGKSDRQLAGGYRPKAWTNQGIHADGERNGSPPAPNTSNRQPSFTIRLRHLMSLRLGDLAPNFSATTTEGTIEFHQWLGNSWGVLFSHPADFTPVCTTELGAMARLKDEFDMRNMKVIALSVDSLKSHQSWLRDINETQGVTMNFPIIADEHCQVATA